MLASLKKFLSNLFFPQESQDDARIHKIIELVVDGTDRRIRLLSDYKNKLRPGVKQSLGYADAMVAQIPGPIEFNRKAFGMNPLVHAVFGSADNMQRTFSLSRALIEFFGRPENVNVTECYALLGMDKQERKFLGSKVQGEILRRDVQQISVSFSEQRLIAPCRTLEELRAEIINRILMNLATCALEELEDLRSSKNELEEQYRRLQVKLHVLETRRESLESLVQLASEDVQQVERIKKQLQDIGSRYEDTSKRLGTLDDHIALINRILQHPEEHCTVTQVTLRLTTMGVVADGKSTDKSDDIQLAEVRIGKFLHAFGVIVKYPRDEMVPREAYLSKARAYLDFEV